MRPLEDGEERRVIREALNDTVIVEAAAGTGKTTELVRRIVATLRTGRATVDTVVAVTFTEKAAGELKLRLRAALERARHDDSSAGTTRSRLDRALARLEEARVNTIHGLCADLLRERPVEARVDPRFRVLTEGEAERVYNEAFALWMQRALHDPPEGLRRSLHRRPSFGDGRATERLRQAGWALAAWRDFPGTWRRDPFDREGRVDTLVRLLHSFAELTRRCARPERDPLYRDTAPARRASNDIQEAGEGLAWDADRLEAALVALARDRDFRRPRSGQGEFYARDIRRAAVETAHEELCSALEQFARDADADLAPLLQKELRQVTEAYEHRKQRSGTLDFVDLLVRARDLVRDHETVRRDFQTSVTHIFVDEFQDTDPLQAEILLLLASAEGSTNDWRSVRTVPGKLFLVGDPKQSIYRFRRADVGTYVAVKEQLLRDGARVVHLRTSFRSVPSIQCAVNAAFAPLMVGDADTLQAGYVPLASFREEQSQQPTVVALPVPRPYGMRRIAKAAIEKSLPDAVGGFVHWLLEDSGWTVTERDDPGKRVPVAARHICLLFRRFESYYSGDVTRAYAQALEARGIAHVLVGGRSFHAREEVETLRTALAAIEWPDDELSVFATLRGSLFAVGDEELLHYRRRHGGLHPLHVPELLPGDDAAPVARALEVLAFLHRQRNEQPIAETINLLLESTRAHAGFVMRPSGEQVLANVLHIAELARTYERGGDSSFGGFVGQLLADADRGQATEAPILEEGSEGVRMMTAHRAKGLEFPVVVLADITARPNAAPGRYVDPRQGLCALRIAGWAPAELLEHEEEERARDSAEGLRIAYVAATRARDLLVVPAVGDAPFESGWVGSLNGAIYPPDGAHPQPAAGCPPFGEESVCDRPAERFDAHSVRPGQYRFAAGGYDAVWWDPWRLWLDAAPLFGIRQERLIGKRTEPAVVEADLKAHEFWQQARRRAIDMGALPSLRVQTVTGRAAQTPEDGAAVQVVDLPRDTGRPGGRRFGTLVHAALAAVPIRATREQRREVVELHGRILGATGEEMSAALDVLHEALRHPLFERARRAESAGACRREAPVTLCEADGSIIDGVVDLAFREDGEWTVVEFKTDHDAEDRLPAQIGQAALYARAVAAATGAVTRAVLLRL